MDIPCTVRRATPRDAQALVRHNCAMAHETEGKELDRPVVTRGVSGLFERPGHGFYLVAERDGAIVGSLMVTSEWSDWRDGFFWWVQSVYVLPAHRRRGLFRTLHRHVRDLALEAGDVCGLRLYVERDNAGAHRTYEAVGMRETAYRLWEEGFAPACPSYGV